MKTSLICIGLFFAFSRQASAEPLEFDPSNRLDHEVLVLRPEGLPFDVPGSRQPLDNFQKTMAIVAVCSLVLSAISLGYRISQDQKKD